MADLAINDTTQNQVTPFGKPMLKHWLFDPTYRNLNHGMYHPRYLIEVAELIFDQAPSAHTRQRWAPPSANS